jgi:hypothetical protein
MNIKTYIKKLQKLANKYPKAEVVYSMDDGSSKERKGILKVAAGPSAGSYQNEASFSDLDEWTPSCNLKPNAILLN